MQIGAKYTDFRITNKRSDIILLEFIYVLWSLPNMFLQIKIFAVVAEKDGLLLYQDR